MTVASFIERSKKDREDWKYTDLQHLLEALRATALSHSKLPDATLHGSPQLVFMNGIFQAQLSRFGSVPSCILMGEAETGYTLTLGEHTCLIAQPIELVFATDEHAADEISIKLTIEVGDNGRLSLLEHHLPSPSKTSLDISMDLHPRAKVVHGKIVAGGIHLAENHVTLAGGAYYNNFSLIRGASLTRNEIEVKLLGQEAQATLCGAMLLRGSEHADTKILVKHEAPHCASRQVYKTVLDGKSRGVFQGKILVAPDAQKTDGYQLSRALLLSDQAEMDAKPELEIYADDVKCSHGSTIGDLDENALFYLRARGLPEIDARALLIEAFVAELLDEIHVEEWRDIFRQEIEGWST